MVPKKTMGLRFRLNFKRAFPVNSHSPINFPSKRLSPSLGWKCGCSATHRKSTLSKAINQIQKARKSINTNLRKYPDDDENAKLIGLSLAKVRSASQCLRVLGSVDHKTGGLFSETVIRQHMKKGIHDLLKGLDSKERQVPVLHYGFKNCQPKSLEKMRRLLQVNKERIRNIENRALKKLRE